MTRAAALALGLALAACGVPNAGPMMAPGQDCVECHARGDGEPTFTAGGTVFGRVDSPVDDGVMNVRVRITDANGRTVTLRSNRAGNFYTRERLAFPISASIEKDGRRAVMLGRVVTGACNSCHALPPLEDAPGRLSLLAPQAGSPLMLPGEDCLACHDGAAAQRWTLAGTWAGGAGAEVRIAGSARPPLAVNEVGNFYTDEPLAFPRRVEVARGAEVLGVMEPLPEMTHGSCNRCHPGGSPGEDD